jgi:hypothetical protein
MARSRRFTLETHPKDKKSTTDDVCRQILYTRATDPYLEENRKDDGRHRDPSIEKERKPLAMPKK